VSSELSEEEEVSIVSGADYSPLTHLTFRDQFLLEPAHAADPPIAIARAAIHVFGNDRTRVALLRRAMPHSMTDHHAPQVCSTR
jgi:hypothetical protein